MTTYVFRDGRLIEKTGRSPVKQYRFDEYLSPVNGALITSSRQRERDLEASGSFDPRDLSRDHRWSKGRDAQREEVHAARGGQQFDFWRE